MNSKLGRGFRHWAGHFLTIVAALCFSTEAFAQAGKISAKVTDAKTGEALVRATVQIVQTKQGAYTKDDGVATIINVKPQENLTVIAKFVGYQEQRITGVRVQSDVTTSLSFKLSREGSTDTVVVRADRQMVEKSKTEQGRKFSQTEVVNTPGRQRIDEIIKLTPGVYTDNSNGGLSINGGRSYTNSVKINNVETQDVVDGRTSTIQNSLSKFAVSELDIKTSGSDASSGSNLGGAINTTTRTGGENYTFNAHYRQEVPALFGTSSNGYKQMPEGNKLYEFALGGPIVTDLGFFLTVKGWTRDFYNYFVDPGYTNGGLGVVDPLNNNLGQVPNTDFYSRSASLNFTYNLSGFRIQAGGIFALESRRFGGIGTLFMDQDLIPGRNEANSLYSLQVQGPVGDAVIQVNGSLTKFRRDAGRLVLGEDYDLFRPFKIYAPEDKYSYDESNGRIIEERDGIIDLYTPVSRQIPDPRNPANNKTLTGTGINPFSGKIEGDDITFSSANAYGLPGYYVVAGNIGGFSTDTRDQIQIDGNYRQQLGTHFITAGVDVKLYDISRYSNSQPWDANPFKDSFSVNPYIAGVYVSNKMEFNDITLNPSLRFDIYNPAGKEIVDLYNPILTVDGKKQSQLKEAEVQSQLSPRLGITYAVTEQTTFNFNYNWYFKPPLLNNVLTNLGGDLSLVLQRGNQQIGNGGLKAERAKEIVVGFNTQLTDVFAFMIQGVYKDFQNQAGLQRITSSFLPVGYTIFSDDQYGNYRAVQFSAEKRMSENWSARVNYTLSTAKATSSSALENYSQLINIDPNSEEQVLPLTPFYTGYDKPHVLQLILNASFAKGEGPQLFGVPFLQNFSFNATSEYSSGTPYTRVDERGRQIGEYNADRHPDYFQTDATISRDIPLGDFFGESANRMFFNVELEVTNLFNRTEALYVYATTGQGDDDGSLGILNAIQEYYNDPTDQNGNQFDALGRLLYNPRWDLNRDNKVSREEQQVAYSRLRKDRLDRRTNFQAPRRVFLNLSFRF